jgi:lipopolysaccharide transport system permease protein
MSSAVSKITSISPTADVAAPAAPVSTDLAPEDAELIIRPRRGWIGIDWRELWRYRELLLFLVWRDVKVKYKQAILGFAWAVLVPVLSMMIFTMIGKFAGFTRQIEAGIPYSLWVFAGLVPWLFLQAGINNGGLSLLNQQNLLSKIYLPRLFIPTSTCGSALIDMALSFVVFTALMALNRFVPPAEIVFLPLLIILAIACSLGSSYLLSALTINYRDVRFLIPFLAQILMWLSAVMIPDRIFGGYRHWLAINPMYGIIAAFRSVILGTEWHRGALIASIVQSITLLVVGLFYFRKAERRFADIA